MSRTPRAHVIRITAEINIPYDPQTFGATGKAELLAEDIMSKLRGLVGEAGSCEVAAAHARGRMQDE